MLKPVSSLFTELDHDYIGNISLTVVTNIEADTT